MNGGKQYNNLNSSVFVFIDSAAVGRYTSPPTKQATNLTLLSTPHGGGSKTTTGFVSRSFLPVDVNYIQEQTATTASRGSSNSSSRQNTPPKLKKKLLGRTNNNSLC